MDDKEFNSINVIPLVDIMLVLLTIVLTTATFMVKGELPVDVPKAPSAGPQKQTSAFVITITKEGKIFAGGKEVSLQELKELLQGLEPNTPIEINADRRALVEHLVDVLDKLNELNLRNVSLIVRKE
ncbi:MAG: biopolymer transporter ExbD [Aquificae bacterium]|nr:biopolymer transporter ExbD [Aquificota bacterium]